MLSYNTLILLSSICFNCFFCSQDRFVVSAAWKDKIENDVIFLEKKVNSLQMAGKYLNEGALGGLSNMSPPRLASSFPSSPVHSDWHQVSQRQENVLLEKLESRLQDRVSMCDISVCVVTLDVCSDYECVR
jgi:hypothetical protein